MSSFLFSPLDVRYAKDIPEQLSEQAFLRAQVAVEKAWLLTLAEVGVAPKITEKALDKIWSDVSFEEIEEIEQRTRHATRAIVEALAARLTKAGHKELANWVHVGLTSFDTVDTAQRYRLKNLFDDTAFDLIAGLKHELKRLAEKHKSLVGVGRTHGQWAVPTLFGLQFAEAFERIDQAEKHSLRPRVGHLRGQSSGAIGGYHASSLLGKDPIDLENRFLKKLGLQPHYGSTQILPPEDVLELAQSFVVVCSVAAKLANDLRHLARSEIGEVAEGFAKGQVGSSTMPQKRNPWNLEHVCSLFKVATNRLQLLEADMISEHQRDLTNSASGRFHAEVFSIGCLLIKRLTKVLSTLEVVEDRVRANYRAAGSSVYAEAFYVMATREGCDDGHDVVREASRRAESKGIDLLDALKSEKWLPKKLTLEVLEKQVLEGSRLKYAQIAKGWKGK